MKYFVCNCFYEFKLSYGIISIKKLTLKDFGLRYVTSVKNDCCYIYCKQLYFCLNIIAIVIFTPRLLMTMFFFNEMVKSDNNEDIYLMPEEAIFFHFSSSLILFSNEPV